MVVAWLFIYSCMAAYAAPKFASDSLYDAIDGGHAISMLSGWDRRLVDECYRVGPILFEGVDRFNNWWLLVFVGDPAFVFLGVHSTSLDDAQADVDDITIPHRVASRARVGSAYEEASCEGLKTVGGMPVGSHLLPILFTILSRNFAVLRDEPIEHV
jgi:hypothetical protein